MGFKLSPLQHQRLEEIDSTYKFTARPDRSVTEGQFQCEIQDNYRNRVWCEGFGQTEEEAFEAALAASYQKAAPNRPGEHATQVIESQQTEIEQLKAKIAKLEGKTKGKATDKTGEAEKPPAITPPPKPPAPKPPAITPPPKPPASPPIEPPAAGDDE